MVIKEVSPARSSFLRSRLTLTVRVFSSTKLSPSHKSSHQPLPADHAALASHEGQENAVLILGQVDVLPLVGQSAVPGVEQGPPVLQHRHSPRIVIGPAQDGLYLGNEHTLVKGLGDKVVRPQVHGHHQVHVVRGGGEKDNGHLGDGADLAAPVEAVEKGKPNIHQHQVRLILRKLPQYSSEILHTPGLQPPGLQLGLDRPGNSPVILHD